MRNCRTVVVLALMFSSVACLAGDNDLFSALYAQSSDANKIRRVRAAIVGGANVNTESMGSTALIAATRENPILVNELLRAGADPNKACGLLRMTPLMEAVRRNAYPAVMLLVASGARVNAQDMYGRTALDILEGTNPINRLMHKLLKSYGAKHGTLEGKSIDAMLASGDYRDLVFNAPPVLKVGQKVQWVSSTNIGREFQGTRPYWLYEGPTETMEGVVVTVGELETQVKVTRGLGAFRAGSVHQILNIDIDPVNAE